MDKYGKRYKQYAKAAELRGLPFCIDAETFEQLVVLPCKYCGLTPLNENTLNGLDRIDNSLGYIIDNIVPCCSTCNWAKRTTNASEFVDWAKKVTEHQKVYQSLSRLEIPTQTDTIDFYKEVDKYMKKLLLEQMNKTPSFKRTAYSMSLTPRQLRYLLKKLNLNNINTSALC